MVKGQLFGGGQQAVDMWAGTFTLRSRWREVGREIMGRAGGPAQTLLPPLLSGTNLLQPMAKICVSNRRIDPV